jgi:hypothetical protein
MKMVFIAEKGVSASLHPKMHIERTSELTAGVSTPGPEQGGAERADRSDHARPPGLLKTNVGMAPNGRATAGGHGAVAEATAVQGAFRGGSREMWMKIHFKMLHDALVCQECEQKPARGRTFTLTARVASESIRAR